MVNRNAARNRSGGAIVDGIGAALFGETTFTNGVFEKNNLDRHSMIRISEAPKEIEVCFVENEIDPIGMGELAYPRVFEALANALHKATGMCFYNQPFISSLLE